MNQIGSIIEDSLISNEPPIVFPIRPNPIQFINAHQHDVTGDEVSMIKTFENTKPKCPGCGNNLTGTECLNCAKQTIL